MILETQLALWRARYHYRDTKLAAAHHHNHHADIQKWGGLLAQAVRKIHWLEQRIAQRRPARRQDWMAGAEHRPRASAGSHAPGYVHKCLWHTTDGSSDATSTLDANRDWPNFELLTDGRVIQYMPVGAASRSLAHPGGFPETNRGGPCQIEVVGVETGRWPAAQVEAAASLARFIERNHSVERACHVKFHPAGGVRLKPPAWEQLAGHCGHCHVPNNDHEDPGPIDTTGVLAKILS